MKNECFTYIGQRDRRSTHMNDSFKYEGKIPHYALDVDSSKLVDNANGLENEIQRIQNIVRSTPYMTAAVANVLTKIIVENQFTDLLELGFCHGVSTCYFAGALKTLGRGQITTIDLISAKKNRPNIHELLKTLDLERFVRVFFEPSSYNWRLMKFLEERPQPQFDFCYFDGAHDWTTTGFSFFLVDKLLKPGGLVVFDDLHWTHKSSTALKNTFTVFRMPNEEKSTAQIQKVFDLLVKTHPSYGEFKEIENWGFARKLK